MEANIVDIVTVGGPVAAFAILSLILYHRITMRWADQVDTTYRELNKTLGEVCEALHHLNGKK